MGVPAVLPEEVRVQRVDVLERELARVGHACALLRLLHLGRTEIGGDGREGLRLGGFRGSAHAGSPRGRAGSGPEGWATSDE